MYCIARVILLLIISTTVYADDLASQHDKIYQQLKTTEVEFSNARAALYQTNKLLTQQLQSLKNLQTQQQTQQAQLATQQLQLNRCLTAILKLQSSKPQHLFTKFNINHWQRINHYHQVLYQHYHQSLQQQQAKLATMRQQQASYQRQIVNTQQQQKSLRQRQTMLQSKLKNYNLTLDKLRSSISAQPQVFTNLDKSLALPTPHLSAPMAKNLLLDNKLISYPLAKFSILSHHLNKLNPNSVLLSAKPDTEVTAIYRGKVVYASWLRGYGLLMIIDHQNGWMSLYGHNQSLFKQVGDTVQDQEIIALVGQSGGQQLKPCLYFEIRKFGQPVNLIGWLKHK